MTIRNKLALAVLCASIIPLLLLGFGVFLFGSEMAESRRMSELQGDARLRAWHLEEFLRDRCGDMEILQSLPDVRQALRPGASSKAVDNETPQALIAACETRDFEDIVLLRPDGEIVSSATGRFGQADLMQLEAASVRMDTGAMEGVVFSNVYCEGTCNTLLMWQDIIADGASIGRLAVKVKMRFVRAIMEERSGLGSTGEALLAVNNPEGVRLLAPFRDASFEPKLWEPDQDSKAARTLTAAFAGPSANPVGSFRDYRGERVAAAFAPVAGLPWLVVTKTDRAEIAALVGRLGLLVMAAAALSAASALAIGYGMSRGMLRSLVNLRFAMARIGAGKFDVELDCRRRDELGLAGAAFQRMARDLKRITASRDDLEREVEQHQITARRLHDSRTEFQAVFDNAAHGISLIDLDGTIRRVNDRLSELTGIDREELEGSNYAPYFPEADARIVAENIADLVAGHQKSVLFEVRFFHGDGHLHWARAKGALVRDDDGSPPWMVFTVEDITDLKATQESNHRLRVAIDSAPDGIFLIDPEVGLFVDANHTGRRLLGCSNGEIFGMGPHDIDVCYEPSIPQRLKESHAGAGAVRYETVIRRLDGAEFPAEMHASMSMFCGKQYYALIMHDITSRKSAQEKLERSERDYRELVQNLNTIILRIDCNGRMTFCNEFALRFFGYTEEELLGKHIVGTVLEDKPEYWSLAENAIAHPERFNGHENESVCREGRRVWISWTVSHVLDESGNVSELLCAGIDMTERRQAEKQLRRLEMAVEQAADSVLITDASGNVEYVNPSFCKVHGYDREEVKSRHVGIFYTGSDELDRTEEIWSNISTGKVWQGSVHGACKDGSFIETETNITPLCDDSGAIVSHVGVMRDVTEQRRMERRLRQSQKLEAIGTLAGGIAHDFNNALAAIMGYTDVALLSLPENSMAAEDLDNVLQAARRARDLVRQILTFSRFRAPEDGVEVDLGPILKEALKLLRPALPSNIEVVYSISDERGAISADPTQLHQVVMNLATNAYQAMRSTGGVLELKLENVVLSERLMDCHPSLGEGKYARLTVSDTGVGIDPAIIDRIFDPYFTTKAQGEGTGLGLATVQGIVAACGGGLAVKSQPGQGASFQVYLPIASEAAQDPLPLEGGKLPGGNESILVVDDEEHIVRTTSRLLENLGYNVRGETDSSVALAVLQDSTSSWNMLLTDQTMPGMTGLQLIDAVRASRPELPIILTTGFSDAIGGRSSEELGISAILPKPAEARDLAQTIRTILDETNANLENNVVGAK